MFGLFASVYQAVKIPLEAIMNLFMLARHDFSRKETRVLSQREIDQVFGADDGNDSIGDDTCDTTMCACAVITPGGDGEPMMDCDGG